MKNGQPRDSAWAAGVSMAMIPLGLLGSLWTWDWRWTASGVLVAFAVAIAYGVRDSEKRKRRPIGGW